MRTDPSSGRQTLVDLIGGLGDDPGDGWAVAGIEVSALPCGCSVSGCSVSASLITLCCVESVVSARLARLKRHDRCAQAATKDHTLLRSDAVQRGNGGQWSASAGTSEADSEWIVLESEEWWPVSNRACDDSCGRSPRGDCQGAPQRAVSPRCENIVRPFPLSSFSSLSCQVGSVQHGGAPYRRL